MKLSRIPLVILVVAATQVLCSCAPYRNAAIQGASDVGTVVGTTVGVPLAAAAVAIDETFKVASQALKAPRQYETQGPGMPHPKEIAFRRAAPVVGQTVPPVVITDPDWSPHNALTPVRFSRSTELRKLGYVAQTGKRDEEAARFWSARP